MTQLLRQSTVVHGVIPFCGYVFSLEGGNFLYPPSVWFSVKMQKNAGKNSNLRESLAVYTQYPADTSLNFLFFSINWYLTKGRKCGNLSHNN